VSGCAWEEGTPVEPTHPHQGVLERGRIAAERVEAVLDQLGMTPRLGEVRLEGPDELAVTRSMGGLAMPRGWERQLRDAAGPPDRHFSTSARVPSPENRFVTRNATESSRFGLPLDPVAFQVGPVVPLVGSDQTRLLRMSRLA
jgi:hypothetical protein